MKVLLLIFAIIILGSTVGAYAGTATDTGELEVGPSNTGPLTIGWTLTGTVVDGVTVTWTPVAAGIYTIRATTGNAGETFSGTIITPMTSTYERTDVVPITGVDPKMVELVNVSIVES